MQADFWDKIAKGYSAKPVDDVESYQKTLDRTLEYLGADSDVLEIGGGTGSTSIHFAPKVSHIICTDISPKMIEIAKEKAEASNIENASFQVGTVQSLNQTDRRFDAVLAFNLLHLIPDINSEVAQIYSLLKPGGYFISKSGALGSKAFFLRPMIAIMRFLGKAPFVNFLTEKQFKDAHLSAGFEIVTAEFLPRGSTNFFIVAKRPG